MASFRTGFKIFGELSIKQGLGRIRSFSEDRKPGRWLPEDQWAVRQPGSTCPEPCEKPKKPPKPSKSWLSVCKDPEPPIECDIRHNNCPPPPVKSSEPWYSLENFIPKKKPEKPPPSLKSCREERRRKEICGEDTKEDEEVGEKIAATVFSLDIKPEPHECCNGKPEPCPAPIVTLSCPPPKELDIMLYCGQPSVASTRIAQKCQSDKLPYQEFRPKKIWKPLPFSLPKMDRGPLHSPCCSSGPIPYAEFKQVEVPKPLYTRYKSVELTDSNFMLCMVDATCPDDEPKTSLAITPLPNPKCIEPLEVPKKIDEPCPEKPFIEAGSCRPVRLKNAPKYTFREKPTKLIERRVYRNPCAEHKPCDLQFRTPDENEENKPTTSSKCGEQPKTITGTLTDEPQTFQRNYFPNNPPRWMYVLCKPGVKETPLVPCEELPKEPDWCSETDGLKYYDDNNEGLNPKPEPDPWMFEQQQQMQMPEHFPEPGPSEHSEEICGSENNSKFVLMPDCFNIKCTRCEEPPKDDTELSSFEEYIEAKTAPKKKSTKSYPPIKENILYDLQRMCPNLPFDPTKLNTPCRKPPEPDCPQPPKFYRSYSTLTPAAFRSLRAVQLCKIQRRTECGDSSEKCKAKSLVPKPKECGPKPKRPDCAEITLPCCPKSRIPPACDVARPLPPCKKKLAPKPSFSECSKDPLPCPKMTECNCWEKKPNKK